MLELKQKISLKVSCKKSKLLSSITIVGASAIFLSLRIIDRGVKATLKFGKRTLFEDVNLKFTNGNCYGLIGANGSGKSTFLKLLSGELETTTGEIIISKGERVSILKQDHYQFDDKRVIDVVIMGNNDGKIVGAASQKAIDSEVKINDIIKTAAGVLGGGGGGRLTLAQGAGKNTDKMEEAIKTAVDLIK